MDNFLEKLRKNEPSAFRQVYESSYKICAKYIMANNGNSTDAEDMFQESLLVLLTKIKSKDFELTSKVSTYLFGICKRKWLNKLRKNNPLNFVSDVHEQEIKHSEDAELGIFSSLENENNKLQLKALRILNAFDKKDCVAILKDFYFEQLSLSEIAEKQGYTINYAKKKKANCLRYLKNAILNRPHQNGV